MKFCYNCENPLDKENFSIEHIIPNSIGGKLKSSNLLCITCNNLLGSEIDDELAKQLNVFMNFFMIKRERGKFQPMKGKTKDGEEFILSGTEIKSKPKISVDKDTLSFSGNDEEDVKKYLKGVLKKYPQFKIEDIIAKANKGRYYLNEPIGLKFNVGGEKVFRAITKIAVNYYIHKGGDKKYVKSVLDYIKGNDKSKKIWYHFNFKNENLKVDEEKLYHFIKIIGDPKEKVLYCYIELFGTLKFMINLSDEFEGEQTDFQYFYNLFSKAEINKQIEINYNKKEVLEILNDTDKNILSSIQNNIQQTLEVGHKIHESKTVSSIINESVEKVFGNKNESVVTETMLKEFIEDVSYSIAVYLARDKQNGKTHF